MQDWGNRSVLWRCFESWGCQSQSLGNNCPGWEGVKTLPRDFSLSLQNASTFEDVAQVPSAYQKTVPIEAGESWQPKSTVWPMGYSAGAPWSPRHS